MGMVACIAAVPVETLQRLRGGDESIEEYLYPDDGDSEPPDSIDLDKAWHGIHYLLTGTAEGGDGPEALAILGGEEFGPDVGYGPARFLLPGDVKAVSDALARLTPENLAERFNPQDMSEKDIYLSPMWERDGAEALDYALEHYQKLPVLYRDAAQRGDAVILWLC
jgi:hypothetical protein